MLTRTPTRAEMNPNEQHSNLCELVSAAEMLGELKKSSNRVSCRCRYNR